MPSVSYASEATVEITGPDGARQTVSISPTPFCIGRGGDGNHLVISDDRVSRKCAAIVYEGVGYWIEDRGNRRGVFVNGSQITREGLQEGDTISFGSDIPYGVVFHAAGSGASTIQKLVTRLEGPAERDLTGLAKLNLLLEATRLLHSHLPLETVLDAMLDRAITVTDADRALFLEPNDAGGLQQRLARRRGSLRVPPDSVVPSKTAVDMALKQQSAVITEDLNLANELLQSAQSIVSQGLRTIVAIPLYAKTQTDEARPDENPEWGEFLGMMYLDSQRRAAFSKLDRQILDALAIECASVLDNARLVKLEQSRQRVEQELGIARDIQQALLPRGMRNFPHLSIGGVNIPCHAVGGDYFDIFRVNKDTTGFLIADVAGKGLGAALLTTMLQGAFSGMSAGTAPERVFQHINTLLCERTEVGRFATLFYASVDRDGTLTYINAGHPSPLILRRGEVKNLFEEGALPLGLIDEAEYIPARNTLQPGDTLVLFSDGVTEAQNRSGEFFGDTRFQTLLEGQHETALDDLQKLIVKSVQEFSGMTSHVDDLTLLLARYRGGVDA